MLKDIESKLKQKLTQTGCKAYFCSQCGSDKDVGHQYIWCAKCGGKMEFFPNMTWATFIARKETINRWENAVATFLWDNYGFPAMEKKKLDVWKVMDAVLDLFPNRNRGILELAQKINKE